MDLLLLATSAIENVIDIGERTYNREPAASSIVTINGQAFDYPILKKHITIGRGHDVTSGSRAISSAAFMPRLSTDGAATIIEDAGSKNGVLVNSERVRRRVLRHGDIVSFGDDSSLRFVDSNALNPFGRGDLRARTA